jgi:hypothetical protein
MSLATGIVGSQSGVTADVDTNYNVHVNPPLTASTVGFVSCTAENDHGTITGTRAMKNLYASDNNRLTVGMSTPLFDYNFNAAAQATGQWKCLFTTMTITEGSGSILLNANSTATTTTGCALSTWPYFKLQGGAEIYAVIGAIMATNAMEAGQIFEAGFFLPTATTAPADGAYFRITSAGTLGVINYNGTETVVTFPTAAYPTGATLTAGTAYQLGINVSDSLTSFWINNTMVGSVATPTGNGVPFSSVSLPYTVQQRNSGAVTGTQAQWKIMTVHIEQDDLQLGMPFSHVLAAAGFMGYQGVEGGTAGSTAGVTYNTAPTAAALVNATANVTGLGGTAAINPTFTANDDGLVFSFQVPAGGVSQVPRKLIITGVQVHGVVTTTLTGGPVNYLWQLWFGHTAITLATAESASFATGTTKQPRKLTIGFDSYAAAAAAGVVGSSIPLELDLTQSPVSVNPGEYVAIVARNVGTVTTAGVITVMAQIKSYWV